MVFGLNVFAAWKVTIRVYLKNSVLYPGNIVEGFVEVQAGSSVDVVAIRVKATGKEKIACKREVNRGVDESGKAIKEVEECTVSNAVYKQLLTLAGQMKRYGNRSTFRIPPGTYTYPFAFQLPANLPPSFVKKANDDQAEIMYHIKAYVDIPMARDATHRQYFTVVKPMPQKQWIERAPSSQDRSWDVKFCCCIDKGTVHARMFMDRTFIAIDRDTLVVCADIDNSTGQEPVKALEISLMHKLVYSAGHLREQNILREGFTKIQSIIIEPGKKGRIAGTVPLPRGLIPTLTTFNIQSEYWVDIQLSIPWASDPKHTIPVILAQAVDESNWTPPLTWGSNCYTLIPKGQCPEAFYQPPQNPCYVFNPIPTWQPPQGGIFYQPQYHTEMFMPPTNSWSAPAYNVPAPAGGMNANQIRWEGGCGAQYAPAARPPPVDVHNGAAGYGQPVTYGTTGAAASPPPAPMTSDPNQPLLSAV